MKLLKPLLPLLFIVGITFPTVAQQIITGRITDAATAEPLAFVNVVSQGTHCGTASDIDGYYRLECKENINCLELSYIGYKSIVICDLNPSAKANFKLRQDQEILNEVVLTAGYNPAHRIIKKAVANKDKHNPLNYESFKYTSYNKLVVTLHADSIYAPDTLLTPEDTVKQEMQNFFATKHLFLMESVTKRKFKKPSNDEEEVIASRISGLSTPMFNLMATQFQSFSFHEDYITVLNEKYLNPLSKGAVNRFVFEIKDTLYRDRDSVYVISFQPSLSANFESLKGLLYINTDGYALQNVIAEPFLANGAKPKGTQVKIQQQYRKLGEFWFPEQLNTDLVLSNVIVGDQSPIGIGRTYIKDVSIGESLRSRDFGATEIVQNPEAGERDEAFWNQYRPQSLDNKELETYTFIDSVGKAENLDRYMNVINSLFTAELPLGKLSLDLNRLLGFNQFEGFKAGLGLKTNAKFSQVFGLSGFAQYGFKDEQWKYGAEAFAVLYKPNMTKLFIKHRREIVESGGMQTVMYKYQLLSPEYRYLNLDAHVDLMSQSEIGIRSYLNAATEVYLSYDDQTRNPQYTTVLSEDLDKYRYKFAHAALKFRPKDTKMLTNFGMLSIASSLPSLILDVAYAPSLFNNEEGLRMLFAADWEKNWTRIGFSRFKLLAGYASENLPPGFLISGYGSSGGNSILENLASDNSFETLGFGEIVSSKLSSLYMIHDFGSVFGKVKWSDYGIRIHGGALIGDAYDGNNFQFFSKDASKGYFEAGLSIRNLISTLGIGAYSRIGYHASENFKENVIYKLTFAVPF